MALTRWTHSCVTVDDGSGVVVIDPGIWSEPQALLGADAVLLTHTHSDHADLLRIAGSELPVWAPAGTDLHGVPFHPVGVVDELTIAGFTLRAVGGWHAPYSPTCRHTPISATSSRRRPARSTTRETPSTSPARRCRLCSCHYRPRG